MGSGLWVPAGMNSVVVADQPAGGIGITYKIPGCLNGGLYSSNTDPNDCSTKSSYTGMVSGTNISKTVSFGEGQIISIRYRSGADAASATGLFRISGAAGENIGFGLNAWLSTEPGAAMSAVDNSCQVTSNGQIIHIGTGPGYCTVIPNTIYYLNLVTTSSTCLNSHCGINLYSARTFGG